MIFNSLRWRVQRGHLVMIGITFSILPYFLFNVLKQSLIDTADKQLAVLSAKVSLRDLQNHSDHLTKNLPKGAWYQLCDSNGNPTALSNRAPNISVDLDESPLTHLFFWHEEQRVIATRRREDSRIIVFGLDEAMVYGQFRYFWLYYGVLSLGIVTLALTLGWKFAGSSIKPIKDLCYMAKKACNSDRFTTLSTDGVHDELKDLTVILNQSFSQFHHALQQQKNLTADASHELRTPISIIKLELESALRHERSSAEYQERISGALEAAKHLETLVATLLTLALSDAGNLVLHIQPVRIDTLIEGVVGLLSPRAAEAKIQLHTEVEERQWPIDSERITQVLVNLICNTLQHAKTATDIHISAKVLTADRVEISVADNGIGIPDHARATVFERFYSTASSRGDRQQNLGLGLSIVEAIVAAHHGNIRLEKNEPCGARFVISMPLS